MNKVIPVIKTDLPKNNRDGSELEAQMVYELYGLSAEEVALVEGTNDE